MTRPRVLVVDDEVLIARTLKRVLAVEYDVEGETFGQRALARFENGERFDAILVDVILPDLDGRDLFRRLSQIDPEQAQRVLFITGTTADEGVLGYLKDAPVGWLTKPFSMAVLREELSRIVARSGLATTSTGAAEQ